MTAANVVSGARVAHPETMAQSPGWLMTTNCSAKSRGRPGVLTKETTMVAQSSGKNSGRDTRIPRFAHSHMRQALPEAWVVEVKTGRIMRRRAPSIVASPRNDGSVANN